MSLHVEMRDSNRSVETGEVYHRLPTPGDLGGNKQAAVVAWRKRSRFDCSFRAKVRCRSTQSQSPDGRLGVSPRRPTNDVPKVAEILVKMVVSLSKVMDLQRRDMQGITLKPCLVHPLI